MRRAQPAPRALKQGLSANTGAMKKPGKPATKQAVKRKQGRPSKRAPDIEQEICDRLSKGEPLAAICRDDHMPHPNTVREWMGADEEFSSAIARAREDGHDWIAAECLRIADTPMEGVETIVKPTGNEEKRGDMLGHRKLQIETRLKLLAKWDPKRYGERINQHHSGSIGLESLVAGDDGND